MAWRHFSANLPDVDGLKNYQPPVMSRVFASDGRLIAELATERRIFVPFSAIPDMVKQAFVSAEDQNFWIHGGVDPLAIARAAVFDLMHMRVGAAADRRLHHHPAGRQEHAAGQQRGLDGAQDPRGAPGDADRADDLSKQRILELYLNEIYLGLGSYGVAAAAQAYFNKRLDQLTVAGGGVPGRAAEGAEQLQPVQIPRSGEGAARLGAGPHGGRPRHHRGAGGRGEGAADHPRGIPPSGRRCRGPNGSPRKCARS